MSKHLPLNPVQESVITRLKATSSLTTLLGGEKIFDRVPPNKTYPYAHYHTPMSQPDRVFGQGGHTGVFHIDVFAQDVVQTRKGIGATGMKEALAIAEQVIGAIVDPCDGSAFTPLTVEGHDLIDLDVVSVECTPDDDGKTYQVSMMFSFQLEDQ